MNNLDFEEILLDSTVQNKNYEQLNTPISLKRTILFFTILGVLLLILFFRVFYLQTFKGSAYYALSEQNRLRYIPIRAPRGVIYDRYGNILVNNKVSLSLMYFPQEFKDNDNKEEILNEIAQIFNLDVNKIKNSIKNTDLSIDPILLKTNISLKEARDFESLSSVPKHGFQLIEDYTREYIHDEAFSHIIGYTGKMNTDEIKNNPDYLISDIIGKAGIEAYYEKYLHGKSGKQFLEIDASINVNPDIGSSKPISGNDVYLTIDKDLQIVTYNALIEAIDKLNIKKGGALAINPQTGEILSMVSIPSYNINILSQGKPADKIQAMFQSQDMPFMNRIISGLYAPGSTIKPLMAMAALNEKSINPKQTYYFGKQLVVPNIYDPDNPSIFRDWKDQGVVDMETSLAYSCNIYFYAIGGGYEEKNIEGIGSQKIKEY
ncbi:MAG: penicillin-binding transpeptidase domain-containing protein [Candidatus Pacebacteria bacterium]|nr:penicillin-binding transpeptidase domain-containing protein [Candidatus Paceibacterota bacterium]